MRFLNSQRARSYPAGYTAEAVFGTKDVDAINALPEEEFLRLTGIVPAQPRKSQRKSSAEVAAARAARDAEVERIKAKVGPQTPDEQKMMSAAYHRDLREAKKAAKPSRSTGRWTTEEHDEFLTCLDLYGRNWTKAAERITTRTSAQIRSHAQKHFKKVQAAGETVSPPQARAAKPKKRKGTKGTAPPAKKPKK